MSLKMILSLAALVAAPAVVSATTFGYYRSVFCDAQSADFVIEGYASPISMSSDKLCHQTPRGTMAMKIDGGLEENCVILAYDDYGCTSLVGSVPASGKCVAATKARIGSWSALCNVTSLATSPSSEAQSRTHVPGELKRRGKARLTNPRPVKERNVSNTTSTVKDDTKTTPSNVSKTPSTISSSGSIAITPASSAGVTLSSAVSSGTVLATGYNLTSYITKASPLPSMTTTAAPGCANGTTGKNGSYASPKFTTTATFTGTKNGNGTVILAHGGATSHKVDGLGVFIGGLAMAMGIVLVL